MHDIIKAQHRDATSTGRLVHPSGPGCWRRINISICLLGTMFALCSNARASEPDDFRITSLSVNGTESLLTWTNGRPTYQVQMCSQLDQEWTNLGIPTSNSF